MAFTRFHDDDARIAIQLQQQTDQERWYLDTPGNGQKPCFMLDPQIIPQKWGGNLWTHSIDIQSNLLGINKPLTRDCITSTTKNISFQEQLQNIKDTYNASPIDYPTCDTLTTEQSRAILPAWLFKEKTQYNGYILPDNPQNHVNMPFANNISTRIYEKDHYKPKELIPFTNMNGLYTLPTNIYNIQYKGNNNIGGNKLCQNDCSMVL